MSVRQPAVLFLTQHFPPEEIGSAPYCGDLAVWLGDHGYEPHVLTSQPHYPSRDAFAEFRARRVKREMYRGVVVDRIAAWAPAKRSALYRAAAELHFFLLGLLALLSRRVRRNSTVISLGPSIFCVALGVLATKRGGRHIVLLHDIQSGLAQGLDMMRSSWLLRLTRLIERVVLNRTTIIAVLTPEMRTELRRLGVRRPIEVLPLWVEADQIRPLPRPEGPPTVLYSGNLGQKQGLVQLLDLAEEFKRRQVAARLVIRGAGNASEQVRAEVQKRDLDNVELVPLLPRERLAQGLAQGDVHLVPQIPDIADFAIPSKIFNIMAAGRPLVATAKPASSLWRLELVSQAMVCVPPNDAVALADAVCALLGNEAERQRLGNAGRAFILAHHQRQRVLRDLAAMIEAPIPALAVPAVRSGTVIFEPDRHGHPLEWLQHLIRFATRQSLPEPLHFVVAAELQPVLAAEVPDNLRGAISVLALSPREQRLCASRNLAISGLARWWTMRRYLNRTGSSRGCFLSLDHLSLPLALGLGGGECRLDGILFRPSVHYRQLGRYRPTWRERLRDLRKTLLYRRMLRNRSLHNVLSLDPFFPEFAAQRYRGGAKVVALPDPVYRQILQPAIAEAVERRRPRKSFLLFGHITERKGVLVLLQALQKLSPSVAAQIEITLAGSIEQTIRPAVLELIEQLKRSQPELAIELLDRRLDSAELQAQVDAADAILAPYQRFVGSSGVLLWAANSGKPVVTQNFGLLGRLVRDHRLGITVDTTQAAAIAAALEHIVALPDMNLLFDRKSAADFVAQRSPERFAAEIFGH